MKSAVAITLIICGTFIVVIPPISDFLRTLVVARLMENIHPVSINLTGEMSDSYRFGCWLLGAMMIGIGVLASLRFVEKSSHNLSAVNATP